MAETGEGYKKSRCRRVTYPESYKYTTYTEIKSLETLAGVPFPLGSERDLLVAGVDAVDLEAALAHPPIPE